MQLAGGGVLVRVGGVAAGHGAELARADGVEVVGQLVRRRAGLDQREGAAGVLEHVGVGGEVVALRHGPSGCGTTWPARPRAGRRAPCPRRGTSGSPARVGHRVGADAQVAPVEVVGDRAGDREVEGGQLLVHRGEGVLQVAVVHGWRLSTGVLIKIAPPATVVVVFPVGGVGVMLLLVALSGLLCGLLALALQRRLGWVSALAIAGFLWSLAVIALDHPDPRERRPGHRLRGGPADHLLVGHRRSGARRVLDLLGRPAAAQHRRLRPRRGAAGARRWPAGGRPGCWCRSGLVLLAAYSVGIEATQLALARIDRACDVTDVIDNVTGAVLGVGHRDRARAGAPALAAPPPGAG